MEQNKNGIRVFWGRALCVIGILLSLVGAYFVSIALGAVGIVLGVVGYSLGARNLGRATIVLGVVSIVVGLLAGQGVIPGSYDRSVDGFFRDPSN